MCLAKIVFVVFVCTTVINNVFVAGQNEDQTDPPLEKEEKTEPPPLESHSFVALIDILFTDGTKRTCTGTIIHDNAVITAAHCFLTHTPGYADVEMSGSFVVIGTKKMFDTGYENYLPIERIITHPRFRGWTANLALVFTFAGMTTDKPGNVIPLIGEGYSTPVDSNVTILSWGRCMNDEENVTKWTAEKKKRKCSSSEQNNDSCETTTYRPRKVARFGSDESNQSVSNSRQASSRQRTFHRDKDLVPAPRLDSHNGTSHHSPEAVAPMNMHKLSQDSAPEESKELKEPKEHKYRKEPKGRKEPIEGKEPKESHVPKDRRDLGVTFPMDDPLRVDSYLKTAEEKVNALKSFHMDWRRKSKSQYTKENILTIESFGFMNVQTCKKIVDKAMPKAFAIS